MIRVSRAPYVLVLLLGLVFAVTIGTVGAQNQTIKMEDVEKLAKEGLANAEGTRKIVEGAIQKQEKEIAAQGASDLLKHEVEDAKFWFKKADALLAQCKKQVEEKKFTKDLVIDLNQAWRWFVEAGSAIVRASMME